MEDKRFKLHKFQNEAYQALTNDRIREIALVSGIQGGKTSWGSIALLRLITLNKYPNANFLVGAPTYKILEQSLLPTFKKIFTKAYGYYNAKDSKFILRDGGFVYFRTATDPDQVEGIPDCAHSWIDEAGKCSRLFKVNCQARVARLGGKTIYTSTPYALNWLFHEVIKPFQNKEREDICYVEFSSDENPSFPKEEFERQRQLLDARTFRRKFMGKHERMAGLVYELPSEILIKPKTLEPGTRYFAGIDFGFVEGHEFGLKVRAFTPSGYVYDVSEFKQAGLDPNGQVQIARSKKATYNIEHFYCDPARPDMIEAFNKSGLQASGFQVGRESFKGVEAGILKHVQLIKSNRFMLFASQLPHTLDEYETYHYDETDEGSYKTEKPVPLNDHLMDCDRYLTVGTMHLWDKEVRVKSTRISALKIDTFDPRKRVKSGRTWDSL